MNELFQFVNITMKPVHKCLLDICHLHILRASCPKHVFFVNPYMQILLRLFENLHDTQTQHILNMAVANQPVHWFLGGKGLGIQ
jgi:hypothetical protein